MRGEWDENDGCPVGIIRDGLVYSLEVGGTGKRTKSNVRGKGTLCYLLRVYLPNSSGLQHFSHVPSDKLLRSLAKKYLKCSYYPCDFAPRSKTPLEFFFYINSGTSQEQRAAFLAAVVARGLR